MNKTIHVVAAVIRDGNRIFAAARGYGAQKGKWEFPGGKIESGETPEQALRREIKEELELEINVGSRIDTVEYDYPEFQLSMECFWCRIVSGQPVLKEAENAQWLTAETLDSVDWLPADRGLLGRIWQELDAIRPGRYRHFKGKEYEALGIAHHSETNEEMVVYRALYGERGLWVRPAAMWNEIIERDGKRCKRFERIEKDE